MNWNSTSLQDGMQNQPKKPWLKPQMNLENKVHLILTTF